MNFVRAAKNRPLGCVALVALLISFAVTYSPSMFWGYALWLLAPSLATLLLGALVSRANQSIWFCAFAAAPAFAGTIAYAIAQAGPPDAQRGLTLGFIALCQLVALPLAWFLAAAPGSAAISRQ